MVPPRKTANPKSTADSSTSSQAKGPDAASQKRMSDTAQQIWLAGVAAFARAQAESTKLFEGLLKEGLGLEKSALKFAGSQAEALREAVETGVGSARERAIDTWEHLEIAVEGGVRRALAKIGVPDREDIAELSRRVDSLSAQLRRQGNAKAAAAAPAAKPAAAKKSAARKAAPARTARKAAGKAAGKTASKSTSRTRH